MDDPPRTDNSPNTSDDDAIIYVGNPENQDEEFLLEEVRLFKVSPPPNKQSPQTNAQNN